MVVCGITYVGYWANLALQRRRPRTYLTASYFATLGFAYPTALGAKVAAPDRAVISLSGDGGFMYALPELATAVQYGINVVAIVFVSGVESLLCSRMADRLADNRGTPFDPSKEFWGQGMVQIIVPLLNGFPLARSTPRLCHCASDIEPEGILPDGIETS